MGAGASQKTAEGRLLASFSNLELGLTTAMNLGNQGKLTLKLHWWEKDNYPLYPNCRACTLISSNLLFRFCTVLIRPARLFFCPQISCMHVY